jgi:hypothetical protein
MNKHILAAVVGLDEAVAFLTVEPFDSAVAIVALSHLNGVVILKTDTYGLKRLEHGT